MCRSITINWQGPFPINEVLNRDQWEDYGLFQVYRGDTLFYIGMTRGDTFSSRIKQSGLNWLDEMEEVEIRIGQIRKEDYEPSPNYAKGSDWWQLVEDAKRLEIYHHKPPRNKAFRNRYKGQALCIKNKGHRGGLKEEIRSPKPTEPMEDDIMPFTKEPQFSTKIKAVHKAVETINSFCSERKETNRPRNTADQVRKYTSADRIYLELLDIKSELEDNFDE